MRVFLIREKGNIHAVGDYDPQTGSLTVLQGSQVSSLVSNSPKFRGAKSIEASRSNTVKGNIVQIDVVFKSPSTAANYVTGSSTNGLITWKTASGDTLKDVLAKEGKDHE